MATIAAATGGHVAAVERFAVTGAGASWKTASAAAVATATATASGPATCQAGVDWPDATRVVHITKYQ